MPILFQLFFSSLLFLILSFFFFFCTSYLPLTNLDSPLRFMTHRFYNLMSRKRIHILRYRPWTTVFNNLARLRLPFDNHRRGKVRRSIMRFVARQSPLSRACHYHTRKDQSRYSKYLRSNKKRIYIYIYILVRLRVQVFKRHKWNHEYCRINQMFQLANFLFQRDRMYTSNRYIFYYCLSF